MSMKNVNKTLAVIAFLILCALLVTLSPTPRPAKAQGTPVTSGVSALAVDVVATSPTLVKNTGGSVVGWFGFNPNTGTCYLQFYNSSTTGAVTVGTNALHPFGVPAGQAFNITPGPIGMFSQSLGIVVAQSTAATGSTSQCASPMTVTVLYE